MVEKLEWNPAALFFPGDLIVTNLPMDRDWVAGFYARMLKNAPCGLR